ncbi:tetratricopeptide repeat protein [Candidatus Bipolaricaulota bacterium]|nr:tetratricopeptide repeat protein [Candidatus Bipolaricaulota bacterium]MBS3825483.1 tetratricopeptide repeat protein [Candidatus Bipolaricaulota bacterium]
MARHKESERSTNVEVDYESNLSLSERKEKVSSSLEKAKDLRKQENYKKGIDLLLDALKLGVNKDEIYYRLGNIYFDAGDMDRAEYSYERAIEENEKHVNAQHNLAVVYKKLGKIGKSVKQRKKAKKIQMKNPKDPDLSDEARSYAKKFAFKLFLTITLGIAGIGLLIYLASRFFF